jgi:hypothetical protein
MSLSASFSTPDAMSEFRAYPFVASGAVLFLDANDTVSYPGSGTTWYDISGNSNNFTMATYGGGSNPSITTSGSLKYFQFPGINSSGPSYTGGGYFTRGASINMDYSTTTVWFNNNTSAPYVLILGGTGYETGVWQGVEMFLNGSAIGYNGTTITTGGGTAYQWLNTAYSYNTWYNLTQTFDGTTQKQYVNGAFVTSSAKSGVQNRPAKNYMIGAHHLPSGNPAEFMNGAIGQYLIYDRALSADEVLKNYNSQAGLYGYGGGGAFYITNGQGSSCTGGSYPNLVYGNNSSFLTSTRYYTDAGLTTPFNGGGSWYMDSTFENGTTVTIDSSGYQTSQYAC